MQTCSQQFAMSCRLLFIEQQGIRLRQKKHSTMELLSCAVLFLLWVIEIRLYFLRFVRPRRQ